MSRDEFIKQYNVISARALAFSEKARKEGLLAVEDDIDRKKADGRDIFEYGMSFAVDGTDPDIISRILSNIVDQENDENLKRLKTIQQYAVLQIQSGTNPFVLLSIMNSYTDLNMKDDETLRKYLE